MLAPVGAARCLPANHASLFMQTIAIEMDKSAALHISSVQLQCIRRSVPHRPEHRPFRNKSTAVTKAMSAPASQYLHTIDYEPPHWAKHLELVRK